MAPLFQVTSQNATNGEEKQPKLVKKPSQGLKTETGTTRLVRDSQKAVPQSNSLASEKSQSTVLKTRSSN